MNYTNNISFISFNVRSISSISKFNHFKSLISALPRLPNIMVVQETWFSEDLMHLYDIPEFVGVHSCRRDSYGGVSIYVHKELDFEVQRNIFTKECNLISIKVLMSKQQIFNLTAVYRPPRSKLQDFIQVLQNSITISSKLSIIAGDTNVDLLKNNKQSESLLNSLAAMGFSPCNYGVTRDVSSTCIDHIYSNEPSKFPIGIELLSNQLSDHKILCCEVKNILVKPKNVIKMHKTIIDYEKVKSELAAVLTIPGRYSGRPNDMYNKLHIDITDIVNKNKTTTSVTSCHKYVRNPWVGKNLEALIKRRNAMFRKVKRNSQNIELKNNYERINRIVNEAMKTESKNYYKRQIGKCKGDVQKVWKVVNEALGKRSKSSKVMELEQANGEVISNPSKISSLFNTYFSEIGTTLSSKINTTPRDDVNMFQTIKVFPSFDFDKTDVAEMESIILSLETNKSAGIDEIPPRIVKNSHKELAPVLVELFNKMVEHGEFPEKLKIQKTIPIHKGGDQRKIENYRPIVSFLLSTSV